MGVHFWVENVVFFYLEYPLNTHAVWYEWPEHVMQAEMTSGFYKDNNIIVAFFPIKWLQVNSALKPVTYAVLNRMTWYKTERVQPLLLPKYFPITQGGNGTFPRNSLLGQRMYVTFLLSLATLHIKKKLKKNRKSMLVKE